MTLQDALHNAELEQARRVAVEKAARKVIDTRQSADKVDPSAIAELHAVLLEGER